MVQEGGVTPMPEVTATTATTPALEQPTQLPEASLTPTQPLTTVEPTATSTVAATVAATLGSSATAAPEDPRSSLGLPKWEDSFKDGRNWSLYSDDFASFKVDGGKLVMSALSTGPRNSWMLPYPSPENFYVEMEAETSVCTALDRYGFIVRTDASSGYWFLISCDGRYSFTRWDGTAETGTRLVDWTSSSHIASGSESKNRVGIWVSNRTFKFYANGYLLSEFHDAGYDFSGFGVMVGAQQTAGFAVSVSEIAYWELP